MCGRGGTTRWNNGCTLTYVYCPRPKVPAASVAMANPGLRSEVIGDIESIEG